MLSLMRLGILRTALSYVCRSCGIHVLRMLRYSVVITARISICFRLQYVSVLIYNDNYHPDKTV